MTSAVHLPQEDRVLADINYVVNAPTNGEPDLAFYDNQDDPRNTLQVRPGRRVTIINARSVGAPFSLDRNGFQLCRLETAIRDFPRMETDQALADQYFDEIEQFLLKLTGGAVVLGRRDSLRTRYGEGLAQKHAEIPSAKPVRFAHADYTDSSAAGRPLQVAADQLKARASPLELSQFSRYAYYNVWRCFSPPPQDIPLAVCDMSTVEPDDEVPLQAIAATLRHGEIVHGTTGYKYNPSHRWYYYRDMTPDEVLVFKQHDSANRLRRAPHTAFSDPSCPSGVPTRNSVEVRAAVFFK
jgi:hypothetical protein